MPSMSHSLTSRRVRSLVSLVLISLLIVADGVSAQESLSADNPKFQLASSVYQRLVIAIGDGRPPPLLRVAPRGRRDRGGKVVAWYDARSQAVVLDELAFDVALSFGEGAESALALLLGHELAHYFRGHDWGGDFGNAFAGLDVADAMRAHRRTSAEILRLETEADYFGGIYNHLAGYDGLEIAPRLLGEIYAAYDLEDRLEGYPGLAERAEIAVRTSEELRQLLPLFDAGNGLLVIGRPHEAGRLYETIARTFPGREILNNLGVAKVHAAMALFPPGEPRFAYPLELDPETRLAQRGRPRGDAADAARRESLLVEAQRAFEQSVARDPAYSPALLNLAAVYELRGVREMAIALAGRARGLALRMGDSAGAAGAEAMRAIALANSGSPQQAAESFAAAQRMGSPLGERNLAILRGRAPAGRDPSARRGDGMATLTSLVLPADWAAECPVRSVTVPGTAGDASLLHLEITECADLSQIVVDADSAVTTLVSSMSEPLGGDSNVIELGSSFASIAARYGLPDSSHPLRAGALHRYAAASLVVATGQQDRVSGWMLYSIQER